MAISIAQYAKYTINGILVVDCSDYSIENSQTHQRVEHVPKTRFNLLALLCENKQATVSYNKVYANIRSFSPAERDRIETMALDPQMIRSNVYPHMSNLLDDLESVLPGAKDSDLIKTIRGTGYKLDAVVEKETFSIPVKITDLDSIEESLSSLENIVNSLTRPEPVDVPDDPMDEEDDYIEELYRAYSDKEHQTIDETNINTYDFYAEDLRDRREDYFAAETVRRGLQELNIRCTEDQFGVLKRETKNRVKNVERAAHPNGYERMLQVMDRAAGFTPTDYLFAHSPYWINSQITQGVCHFLVKDGELKWVRP